MSGVAKSMALTLPPPAFGFPATSASKVLRGKSAIGKAPFVVRRKGLTLKPIYEGGLKPIDVRSLLSKADAFGVSKRAGKGRLILREVGSNASTIGYSKAQRRARKKGR